MSTIKGVPVAEVVGWCVVEDRGGGRTLEERRAMPTNKALDAATKKGAAAYREGQPRTANPYVKGRARSFEDAWFRGFDDARDADLDAVENLKTKTDPHPLPVFLTR